MGTEIGPVENVDEFAYDPANREKIAKILNVRDVTQAFVANGDGVRHGPMNDGLILDAVDAWFEKHLDGDLSDLTQKTYQAWLDHRDSTRKNTPLVGFDPAEAAQKQEVDAQRAIRRAAIDKVRGASDPEADAKAQEAIRGLRKDFAQRPEPKSWSERLGLSALRAIGRDTSHDNTNDLD